MNFWKICAFSTIVALTPAYAGVVDGQASIDYWFVDGHVNHNTQTSSNQSLDKEGAAQLEVSVEHAVPKLPNVKVRHAQINQDASNNTISSDVKIDTTDLVLYYEVLDQAISTDIGIALKRVDGEITNSQGITDMGKTMPMLYASVGTKLPITGLSANVQALATKYNHAKGVDIQAEVKYNVVEKLLYDVGAKIGYRMLDIQFDEKNGTDPKFRFKGPYVGIQMGF